MHIKFILMSFGLYALTYLPAAAFPQCDESLKENCFTGQFGLIDIPGDKVKKKIAHDFGYQDSTGIGWETAKGDITDGASIPKIFQPFIGSPWEKEYIRAAVIHDRYCDVLHAHNVRPWPQTHRVFYDAMLASGVPKSKAKLMFYAVYSFGPTWGYPEPGKKCKVTDVCIQTKAGSSVFVKTPDKYDDEANIAELKVIEATIEAKETTGELTIDDLVKISEEVHPRQDLKASPPSSNPQQ